MKTWKHINFEQRKVIVSGIVHKYKIKEIAETIDVNMIAQAAENGKTIDHYTRKDIKTINATLLQKPLKSLDGNTAKDALVKVFGEELFLKLF